MDVLGIFIGIAIFSIVGVLIYKFVRKKGKKNSGGGPGGGGNGPGEGPLSPEETKE